MAPPPIPRPQVRTGAARLHLRVGFADDPVTSSGRTGAARLHLRVGFADDPVTSRRRLGGALRAL